MFQREKQSMSKYEMLTWLPWILILPIFELKDYLYNFFQAYNMKWQTDAHTNYTIIHSQSNMFIFLFLFFLRTFIVELTSEAFFYDVNFILLLLLNELFVNRWVEWMNWAAKSFKLCGDFFFFLNADKFYL